MVDPTNPKGASQADLLRSIKEQADKIRQLEQTIAARPEGAQRQPFQTVRGGMPIPLPGLETLIGIVSNLAGQSPTEDISMYGGAPRGLASPPEVLEMRRRYGDFIPDPGSFKIGPTPADAPGDFYRQYHLLGRGQFASAKTAAAGLLEYTKVFGPATTQSVQLRDQLGMLYSLLAESRGVKEAQAALADFERSTRGLQYSASGAANMHRHQRSTADRLGETYDTLAARYSKLTDSYVGGEDVMARNITHISNLSRVSGIADTKLMGVAKGYQTFRGAAKATQLMSVLTGQQMGIGDVLGADPSSILRQIGGPLRQRFQDPAELRTRAGQFQLKMIGEIAQGLTPMEVMRFLFRDAKAMNILELDSLPIMQRFNNGLTQHVNDIFSEILLWSKKEIERGDPWGQKIRSRYAASIEAIISTGLMPETIGQVERLTENIGAISGALNTQLVRTSKMYAGLNVALNAIGMEHNKARAAIEALFASIAIADEFREKGEQVTLPRVEKALELLAPKLRALAPQAREAADITGGVLGPQAEQQAAENIVVYAKQIMDSAIGQVAQNLALKVYMDGKEIKARISELAYEGGL